MPPISEDCSSQGESEMGDEGDSNFEQLMVSMLEERDKLQESLRDTQDLLQSTIGRLQDVEKEKNMLHSQLEKTMPPVWHIFFSFFSKNFFYKNFNVRIS